MIEFEIYIYRGLIAIGLIVTWYFVSKWANSIIEQLKELNRNFKQLSDKAIKQEGQLILLNKTVDEHGVRLNDHARQLKDLQHNYDTCSNCKS